MRSPIILIASSRLLKKKKKKYKFKKKIKIIKNQSLNSLKLENRSIYLLNVNYRYKFEKKEYLRKSFELAFSIIKSGITNKFINGPINKSKFFNHKYLGMTEYISKKFKTKNFAMLIYNENLSVCPLTTHLPLKLVPKNINKKLIISTTKLIEKFYKKNLGFKPKIAITGLNPHCESILNYNEDEKIVSPAIRSLKKEGINIKGPFPADTIFLKQNRDKFDVILGMYHDQVLSPMKTLKEYEAINITIGLPFLRVSPDHGPNVKMVNKNLSNPISLIKALQFLDKK